MMFDLEIQSANQPGYHLVVGSKISSRFDLVNSPFVIQLACFDIGNRESSMLYRMCQLEYQAQHKTGNTGKDDKTDQPGCETQPYKSARPKTRKHGII